MTDPGNRKQMRSFNIRLIIPGVLTISAFIISIYFIFIPTLERNMVKQKKQMIKELTHSAWSILESFEERITSGFTTKEEAQKEAIELIKMLRYGEENKDYFWVTDLTPTMIVHPYRPDLNGNELKNFTDPNGKRLFVESANLVKAEDEGFVDYYWQWKDDASRIVPKLSFVKGFKPWGWVVGTGIYMDDVEEEISRLERSLILVSLIIIVFVTLSLIYILRTGLLLESKRQKAVSDLEESRERYRSLVEASNEGTILSLDGKVSYVNPFFLEMSGMEYDEIYGKNPDVIIDPDENGSLEAFREFMSQESGHIKLETKLNSVSAKGKQVLMTVSRILIGDKKASIIVVKELSANQKMVQQIDELGEELQTSLLFMNQPVQFVARNPQACFMNASIKSCAEAMSRKNQNGMLIRGPQGEFLGLVTDKDLRHRVIARGKSFDDPVYSIMSSPVVSVPDNALLFEALVSLQQNKVTHIAVKDPAGQLTGLISHEELLEMQQNTTAFLMRQIEMAEHSDELIQYSRKTRGIVKVLEQSGAKTRNITRIITSVTDALTKKFIEMAIQEAGPPPAPFVFIAMGSEGRGEQTLATDQDNGIIYQDATDGKIEETQNYFLSMGQRVNDWLNQAGYNYCDGDVMAGNSEWCKPLSRWKAKVKDWMVNAEPKAVLEASIFFDFRPISEDSSMCEELQAYLDSISKHQDSFFYQMADQTLKFKSSSNLSSHFSTNSSTGQKVFDVKKVLFPLISFSRLYAIHNQIKIRSTFGRLQNLNQSGKLSDDLHSRLSEGYDFLMMLRYKAQLRAIEKNLEINNDVPVEMLNEMQILYLKKVLGTVTDLQTKIKLDFNIS